MTLLTEALLQPHLGSTLVLGALLLLLLGSLILNWTELNSDGRGLDPPGPRPLPLIGNLLQLDPRRPHHSFLKLSKKYGSVFSVHLGPKRAVVLAGYQTLKEALVNHAEEFGDRDPPLSFLEVSEGHGILWSNGESWKEMRRFALTKLKDFGMGTRACEDKIHEECVHLLEVFRDFQGQPFDTTAPLTWATSNIICSMVYGNRFEYDDPEFTALVRRTNRNAQLAGSPSMQIYNMFPWLRKVLTNGEFFRAAESNWKQTRDLIARLRDTLNPEVSRGLVDAFLLRQQKLKESGVTDSHFHDKNLVTTVIQLFAAGTDTTATTLRWALLLMAKYPGIQDQVQEELRRVVGGGRVQVEDRKKLPLVNAVLHETQRLANIAPMALPHRVSRDVTFQGFTIRKGTTVIPLLTSTHQDETEWEEPHSFHPAHFLDEEGKFVKRDAFMAFSAGRRVCLGESLARMELFLFFSTLLQNFRFTPPPGLSEEDLDLTPNVGLTLNPSAHELRAVPV